MTTTRFEIPDEYGVVLLLAVIDRKFTFRLALDTAATHTTLDSNMLFLAGYELKNSKGEAEIETANGAIRVELYESSTSNAPVCKAPTLPFKCTTSWPTASPLNTTGCWDLIFSETTSSAWTCEPEN